MSESVLFFATVGFIWVLWLITDVLWELMLGMKAHVLPHLKSRNIDLVAKYGSWAGNSKNTFDCLYDAGSIVHTGVRKPSIVQIDKRTSGEVSGLSGWNARELLQIRIK